MDDKIGGNRVLVTGSTGSLGPKLVEKLINEGYQVRVLIREHSNTDRLPKNVHKIIGDITDHKTVMKAVDGVDIVYHLAALLHIYKPKPTLEEKYHKVNIEGTRNVVRASQNMGVEKVIFFSTINVYGSGDGEIIFDENSEIDPETLYAKTKAAAEKIVLDAISSDNGEPACTILRLAAVYGPSLKGNYLHLFKGLKKRWFIPIGQGKNRRTLIYIDDVIRGAILVAKHPASAGKIYNLTDGDIHSFNEIVSAICEALNRNPPILHLPEDVVRFGIRHLNNLLSILGINIPFREETLEAMLEDRAVSGDKIQRELGFKPKTDLIQGWNMVENSYGQ